jgi:hypothetical protein
MQGQAPGLVLAAGAQAVRTKAGRGELPRHPGRARRIAATSRPNAANFRDVDARQLV